MDDLSRFSVLARLLDQEEPPTSVQPITTVGKMTEYKAHGYYLCPCGKPFRDIASKRRHQTVCGRLQ